MPRTCERCAVELDRELPARGRTPRFCSSSCRVAAHRAKKMPTELTSLKRWTRADRKRPITVSGSPASSTSPATWTTYDAVKASTAGDGFGVMLGDGLGCWDLDHCIVGGELTTEAAATVGQIESPLWIERGVSGDGLHIFVRAAEAPGFKRDGVEFYSRARFIRVTGDRFTL